MTRVVAAGEESDRLAAVIALGLLDTNPTPEFDIFAELASRIFGTPIAAISLIDQDRQWFKAKVGLEITETGRAQSFCSHAIQTPDQVLCVQDATADPRFADNLFVTGDIQLRFYAGAPILGPSGHAVGALCVIDRVPRDVTKADLEQLRLLALGVENALRLHTLNQHAETDALRDKLTGLPNRAGLHASADAVLVFNASADAALASNASAEAALASTASADAALASTASADAALASNTSAEAALGRIPRRFECLLVGLDSCKSINDLFGHGGGDAALAQVARRLRRLAAPRDLVARFGSDVFCLLTTAENPPPDLSSANPQSAPSPSLADRIHAAFREPIDIEGQSLTLSVSIGIAAVPQGATSLAATLADADIALQDAKRGGRSATRIAAPHGAAPQGARCGFLSMQESLRAALFPPGREPFSLAMQPIFRSRTLQLCGFEALVRWPLDDGHVRQPNDFIPAAEATGMIVQIDRWALDEACRIAAGWPDEIQVSSNLSAANFFAGNLVGHVTQTLEKHRLPPRRLKLEITESLLLRDAARVQRILAELRRLGVSVVLDDFGAGHASLAYLRDYALDGLKIDRSFITSIGIDRRGEAFLKAIAQMGSALGLQTTAEGVETREQLEALQRYGVSNLQGYLLGRPMSLAQIREAAFF